MPRATAAAAAETARHVMEAATNLFGEHGHADVSLDDVAAASGVTRGAVYHHYGSKRGLFRAVAVALQARVAEAVAAAAESAPSDPFERLRAGSHAFLDAITVGPAARVLLIDAPAVLGWAEWRELDDEHSGRHLRDVLIELGVQDDLRDALAAQLSGAMNEAALRIAERAGDESERAAAHRALEHVLRAVRD